MSVSNTEEGNQLFPVFFRMDQLHLLIVGGGMVGTEKMSALEKHCQNAHITIVAPEIREDLVILAKNYPGQVELIYKPFAPDDLSGKDLVIAATADKDLNKQVWQEAKKIKVLINVADTPDLCDFYLSSVVKKGDLKIAISTNGKSPTFAKRVRELLETVLPDNITSVLDNLKSIRDNLKGDFEEKVKKLDEITSVMKGKK